MRNGHLCLIEEARQQVELMSNKTRTVHSALYSAVPTARPFTAKHIERVLRNNVTDPADIEDASTFVFAPPKKDGSLRLCVDYRKHDAVTIRSSYSYQKMDEYINSFGDPRIFSTLDASSAYWQIDIDERDGSKTVSTSHHGLFQFF